MTFVIGQDLNLRVDAQGDYDTGVFPYNLTCEAADPGHGSPVASRHIREVLPVGRRRSPASQ